MAHDRGATKRLYVCDIGNGPLCMHALSPMVVIFITLLSMGYRIYSTNWPWPVTILWINEWMDETISLWWMLIMRSLTNYLVSANGIVFQWLTLHLQTWNDADSSRSMFVFMWSFRFRHIDMPHDCTIQALFYCNGYYTIGPLTTISIAVTTVIFVIFYILLLYLTHTHTCRS